MDDDLRGLLAAWCGGEVGAERREQLLARLRADAAFREAFTDEVRLLGLLRAAQSAEPRWLQLEDEMGWPAREQVAEALESGVMENLVAPPRVWPWLAAAAALVLTTLGVWFAARPSASGPVTEKSSVPVAVVAQLHDASGVNAEGRALREGDVVSTGRWRMQSGAAALSFFNGATVFVEGEADLELLAMDRVACHRGRLRVRMPEGASGFTITGPGLAVVDLGTEFAMNVAPDGRAALRVFEGKVEASVLNRAGYTLRSELLEENEGAQIEPARERIARAEQSAEDFVAARATGSEPLVLNRSYAEAVLTARPWGYWRMERVDDGMIANEIAERPALRVSETLKLDAGQGENHALIFSEGAPEQFVLMDGTWSPVAGAGHAIEMWVQPAAISLSALANLIQQQDGRSRDGHYFLLQLMGQSQRWLHPNGAVRFLHRFPPGRSGGTNLFSERPYVPGRWLHLVAQHTGARMELYVNGRCIGTAPLEPEPAPGPCGLLLGRLYLPDVASGVDARHFTGALDEVALYDHPLTPEEIARHYALGSPLSRP